MEEAPVLVERRAGYRVITLNRPRQLNAFNEAMHQALKRAPLDQHRCFFHGRLLVKFDDRIGPRHGSAAHRRNRLPTAFATARHAWPPRRIVRDLLAERPVMAHCILDRRL